MSRQPFPEAIPTALGWAHPLTGEQLDSTKGLPDAVDFYKPNARNKSFLDPDGLAKALIFSVMYGIRKVKFAVHALEAVDSIEWDFGDGEAPIVTPLTQLVYVYNTSGTFTVTATVTFVDTLIEPVVLTTELVISIPTAPANTVPPVLSGGQVGVTPLSVTDGTWTALPAPTFTYAWYQVQEGDDTLLADTTASWSPGVDLVGADIYCIVTATNASGSATSQSNTVTVTPEA